MDEVLHIIVTGRVQGVGFRAFTESAARRHGVAGWVRNRPSGEVEVLARVRPEHKGRFLAELQKGPPLSRVRDVQVEPAPEHMDCPRSGFNTRG